MRSALLSSLLSQKGPWFMRLTWPFFWLTQIPLSSVLDGKENKLYCFQMTTQWRYSRYFSCNFKACIQASEWQEPCDSLHLPHCLALPPSLPLTLASSLPLAISLPPSLPPELEGDHAHRTRTVNGYSQFHLPIVNTWNNPQSWTNIVVPSMHMEKVCELK